MSTPEHFELSPDEPFVPEAEIHMFELMDAFRQLLKDARSTLGELPKPSANAHITAIEKEVKELIMEHNLRT
jgi:hypothetical protein